MPFDDRLPRHAADTTYHAQERVIVLCGSLRAGTTLLRLMLGEHPRIAGTGENDYLFDGLDAAQIGSGGTDAERAAFRARIIEDRVPKQQNVTPPAIRPVHEMASAMIDEIMPEAGFLLLTLHRHFDLAAQILPNARFLRLTRDPRDVALSAKRMGWAGNPFYGVDAWRDSARDWAAAAPHVRGPVTTLRFEDLTAAPEDSMVRVFDELDLPFDRAVLSPPDTSTYSAPHAGRAAAWRGELTEAQAAEIDWRCRDLPDEGYERHPEKPSVLRLIALGLGHKMGRASFGIGRYGLPLWAAQILSRRLPAPALARDVRQRVDRIDTLHLK